MAAVSVHTVSVTADRATYRRYIAAFNITDSKAAFENGYYVPLPDSVANRIRARAEIQPEVAQAIVGGIGLGKTTQLFAAAQALRSSDDLEPRYVDVSAIHNLAKLRPSLLLTLVGLELIELAKQELDATRGINTPLGRAAKRINENANGHWEDYDPGYPDEGEPAKWMPGVIQEPEPVASEVAWIEDEVKELLSHFDKRLVVLFDGLDRAHDLKQLVAVLSQDLRALKRLGIGSVIALPERMLFGRERAFLEQLEWHALTAFDVEQDSPSAQLFVDVIARRTPEGLLDTTAIERLVSLSGGVFRDLVVLARSAGEEAYMAGAPIIDPRFVKHAADRFGRKRLLGLTKDQLAVLQRVRKKGIFVETDDSDIALLASGCILQYARPNSRFEVHPTLSPLLKELERAA
jgi:hypothetical protein